MDLSYEFITLIQDMVLKPNLASSVTFFWFSLVNELIAILPYVVLVSGQIVFLEGGMSLAVIYKLFIFIAIPAGIGGAIGSLLIYGIAYLGGKPAIEKYQKYLRFSWEDVDRVNSRLRGSWSDDILFIIIRSIPVLPSLPVNIAAGILRMPPLLYFLYTIIGFVIRLMILFIFLSIGATVLAY